MSFTTLNRLAVVAALALIVSGTVHLLEAPDTMGDASYLGRSFCAHFAVTLIAAVGILMGSRLVWGLGAFVAAASIGMYVMSRTIGLSGQPDQQWLEWAGIIAVGAETLALGANLLGLRTLRVVCPVAVPTPA